MNTESPNRQRRFSSRAERDQYYADVFRSVVQQYVEIVQLPRISAIQRDRDSPSRSRRWTPQDAHYKIDTERATEAALRNRKDLQEVWFQLATKDATVNPMKAGEVASKCGRLYAARGLAPWSYYRKYPHRKLVTR